MSAARRPPVWQTRSLIIIWAASNFITTRNLASILLDDTRQTRMNTEGGLDKGFMIVFLS